MKRKVDLYLLGWHGVVAIAVFSMIFLVAPLLILVPMSCNGSSLLTFPPENLSLRWYRNYFEDGAWISATILSFKLAFVVTIISVILATLTALGLTRARFAGRSILEALVLSPLIVPVIITAVGLYYTFAILGLNGTFVALVIGHTVITLPYATVTIKASLEKFDVRLEQAAMSLGANEFRALTRVTLPLISPGLLVAGLFTFLISFDEVVLALFISGPQTSTLPMKMWEDIRFQINPTITVVSTLLTLFSTIVMIICEILRRRISREGLASEDELERTRP